MWADYFFQQHSTQAFHAEMKGIVSEVLQGSPRSLAVPSVLASDLCNGEDTETRIPISAIQTVIQILTEWRCDLKNENINRQ